MSLRWYLIFTLMILIQRWNNISPSASLNGYKVSIILWVNDTACLSFPKAGLRRMLTGLINCCEKEKQGFNCNEMKIVVLGDTKGSTGGQRMPKNQNNAPSLNVWLSHAMSLLFGKAHLNEVHTVHCKGNFKILLFRGWPKYPRAKSSHSSCLRLEWKRYLPSLKSSRITFQRGKCWVSLRVPLLCILVWRQSCLRFL